MINQTNFELTAGEDRTLPLTAKDRSGTVVDLTGASLVWRLARTAADSALLTMTPTVTGDPTAGAMEVALTADDTDDLAPGDYLYQAIATVGGVTTVCARGVLRVGGMIGVQSAVVG